MDVMVSFQRMFPIGNKTKKIIVNNKRLRNGVLGKLACVAFSHGWKAWMYKGVADLQGINKTQIYDKNSKQKQTCLRCRFLPHADHARYQMLFIKGKNNTAYLKDLLLSYSLIVS